MSDQYYPDPNSGLDANRRRRSQRYGQQDGIQQKAPRRPAYLPDEDQAPLPLGADPRPQRYPGQAAPTVYEEARFAPPGQQEMYDDYEEAAPRRWPWIVAAVILLLAVMAAALYFVVPEKSTGILGKARGAVVGVVDGVKGIFGIRKPEPPKLIKFETSDTQGTTGVKTVFTFTSDKAIDGVRIRDEDGNIITDSVAAANPPENTIWTLAVVFDQPMEGLLHADILRGDKWMQSDKTIAMAVFAPTAVPTYTPQPVFTPAPTPSALMQSGMAGEAAVESTVQPLLTAAVAPSAIAAQATAQTLVLSPSMNQSQATQSPPAAVAPVTVISATKVEPAGAAFSPPSAAAAAVDPQEDVVADAVVDEMAAAESETADAGSLLTQPVNNVQPVAQAEEAPAAVPAMPELPVAAAAAAAPGRLGIVDAVYMGAKKLKEVKRDTPLKMSAPDAYAAYSGGVFTFRGDPFRRNAAFGTPDVQLKKLTQVWKTELGSLRTGDGTLHGVGWTGQAAIVKWAKEIREMMNLKDEKKSVEVLKEVIFAAQDGKIHFLDLNDGVKTREPINIGYPLKGSVSVDPQGRPIIAFGQGVSIMPGKTGDIGLYIYNLIDQKKLYFLNGRKTTKQSQYATNGAFDGTPLFERNSDQLVVAGENGLLYTIQLNTTFDYLDKHTISIDPKIIYQKTKGRQDNNSVSVESSVAMYGKYIYLADKQGYLRCVDSDTMATVWAVDCGDNTDAAIALGFDEDGSLGLYTGNTAMGRLRSKKDVTIRRLDALSGAQIWAYQIKAKYDKDERSGCKASPIVGEQALKDLVIFTVNMTENGGSTVVALNKQTGAVVWKTPLTAQTISSPVAVYAKSGEAYVIQCDQNGTLTLMDGLTGSVLNALDLDGQIDASPAVYKDMLVVGTASRGSAYMYGIRIE